MATTPWPGFAAAAPRLIKMTLLAVSALLSRSSVPTAAAELVELTLLASRKRSGEGRGYPANLACVRLHNCTSVCLSWCCLLIAYACSVLLVTVCLDGSPPAYQLRTGFGSGSRSWLVNLEGGAWCNTTEDCSSRSLTDLGSSKFMKPIEFEGMLSNNRSENPYFYNWNIVDIRYCDGGSFAGDAEGEDRNGTKLFYRGLRIWEAVIDELMAKGMDAAKQALLAGCSAGGLAALLHCDNFRARFPPEVPVKCLSGAGFFLDVKDLSGQRFMRSIFSGVVHLQNARKVLPKDCLAKKEPTECFFPPELIKSITTPTFIRNSGYESYQVGNVVAPGGSDPGQSWASRKADIRNCTSTQIEALNGFRKKMVEALKVAQDKWG